MQIFVFGGCPLNFKRLRVRCPRLAAKKWSGLGKNLAHMG